MYTHTRTYQAVAKVVYDMSPGTYSGAGICIFYTHTHTHTHFEGIAKTAQLIVHDISAGTYAYAYACACACACIHTHICCGALRRYSAHPS